jgi:hypothetical protein
MNARLKEIAKMIKDTSQTTSPNPIKIRTLLANPSVIMVVLATSSRPTR